MKKKVLIFLSAFGIFGVIVGIGEKSIGIIAFYLVWLLVCFGISKIPTKKKENLYEPKVELQEPIDNERKDKGSRINAYRTNYTVIDLETTGLSPQDDRIIELAAIRVRNGKVVDSFDSFVNPERPIPQRIQKHTHITDAMVSDAPIIADIIEQYLAFIGDDIVLGHNVNFDINFIYDNSMRVLGKPFTNDFIDTLSLARKKGPGLDNYKLTTLAEYYTINPGQSHRACDDCLTANSVYRKLFNKE